MVRGARATLGPNRAIQYKRLRRQLRWLGEATTTGSCVTRKFACTHVHHDALCTQFWHLQHPDNNTILLRCICLFQTNQIAAHDGDYLLHARVVQQQRQHQTRIPNTESHFLHPTKPLRLVSTIADFPITLAHINVWQRHPKKTSNRWALQQHHSKTISHSVVRGYGRFRCAEPSTSRQHAICDRWRWS
jgi:hypothetical protein